jgi:hypothetical protein
VAPTPRSRVARRRPPLVTSRRPFVELLESRHLPAISGLLTTAVLGPDTNDTLASATPLGLAGNAPHEIAAQIGTGADVDWYRLDLDRTASLSARVRPVSPEGLTAGALRLFQVAADPAARLAGRAYQLLADSTPTSGDAHLQLALSAGSYFLAVSGAGNVDYHPLVAGSGQAGGTGDYTLRIETTFHPVESGLRLLGSLPADGSTLLSSPVQIAVRLAGDLDPASAVAGESIRLFRSPLGPQLEPAAEVALAGARWLPAAEELVLDLAAPLGPGTYELTLAGAGLVSRTGAPLGADANHPEGQDARIRFVVGPETAGDTPATARDLGDLTGVLRVEGVVGDDPTDPVPFNAADVDLYHFRIDGPGRRAFFAEVFAGRVLSSLNPALSLFRVDPAGGDLELVASNDDGLDPTQLNNATPPFLRDSRLFTGRGEGDYVLAVSASGNHADPDHGLTPGEAGVFDPATTHSGRAGATTGQYVLQLSATPDDQPPTVTDVMLTRPDGQQAAPTALVATFSERVNLPELVAREFFTSGVNGTTAVVVVGDAGQQFTPSLSRYDAATNRAVLLFNEALPTGVYELRLSGNSGLTDFAGLPLVGNTAGGDHVVAFAVAGPARGFNGEGEIWIDRDDGRTAAEPLAVGTLFPAELRGGVVLRHLPGGPGAPRPAHRYALRVVESRQYGFTLSEVAHAAGVQVFVTDTAGGPAVEFATTAPGTSVFHLIGGETYLVEVSGWSPEFAAGVSYDLRLTVTQQFEAPPPLPVGTASAAHVRLSGGLPLGSFSTPVAKVAPAPVAVDAAAPRSADIGPVTARVASAASSVPAGVLLGLGAGPLGGATPTAARPGPVATSAYDRVFAGTPSVAGSEALVRVSTFTQPPSSGTAATPIEPELAPMPRLLPDPPAPATQEEALDDLLDALGLQVPPSNRPSPVVVTPAVAATQDVAEGGPSAATPGGPTPLLVALLFAAAFAAGVRFAGVSGGREDAAGQRETYR